MRFKQRRLPRAEEAGEHRDGHAEVGHGRPFSSKPSGGHGVDRAVRERSDGGGDVVGADVTHGAGDPQPPVRFVDAADERDPRFQRRTVGVGAGLFGDDDPFEPRVAEERAHPRPDRRGRRVAERGVGGALQRGLQHGRILRPPAPRAVTSRSRGSRSRRTAFRR
jgi:hypothetical protein